MRAHICKFARHLFIFLFIVCACLPLRAQRFVKVFDTIPALLAANPNDVHTNAFVVGLSTVADSGGGIYTWYSTSTAATNEDLSVLKANNFSTGRWFRFNGFVISNGTNSMDTIIVNNLYVTNFVFNGTIITNIGASDNWVAEGETNSTLAGIGRPWKLTVTDSVEVGQSGEAGAIEMSSTNGTYTVIYTITSNGQVTITPSTPDNTAAFVLSPDNAHTVGPLIELKDGANNIVFNVLANSGWTGTGTNVLTDAGYYTNIAGGGAVNPSSGVVPFNSSGSFADSLISMASFQTVAIGSLTNPTVLSIRSYDTSAASSYIQGYLYDADGAAEAGLITFSKNTGWGISDPSQRDGNIGFNTLHDNLSYNRLNIDGSLGDFTFFDSIGDHIIFSIANNGVTYAITDQNAVPSVFVADNSNTNANTGTAYQFVMSDTLGNPISGATIAVSKIGVWDGADASTKSASMGIQINHQGTPIAIWNLTPPYMSLQATSDGGSLFGLNPNFGLILSADNASTAMDAAVYSQAITWNGNAWNTTTNVSHDITFYAGIEPTSGAPISGQWSLYSVLSEGATSTTKKDFAVSHDSGYSGAGTLFLSDDGTYKAAGGTAPGLRREVWISAEMMTPDSNSTTTKTTYVYGNPAFWAQETIILPEVAADDNSATFDISLPTEWDGGDVKMKVYWTATTGTATQGVTFFVSEFSSADGENTLNPNANNIGTVYQTDTYQGADLLHVSPAITLTLPSGGGTDEMQAIRVGRDAGQAGDTKTGAVFLLGVKLQYTEASSQPAAW